MANPPLLVEWSPSHVRAFDPLTGLSGSGATLAECAPEAGRDVVLAPSRRSAFVRAAFVPGGSATNAEAALAFQMGQALPLEPREAVFGFRLGENAPGKGRRATVGAVRVESLVRMETEAVAAGLRVRATVPVAFGAWLAARNAGMRDAAVVGVEDGVLNVDLVRDGELAYSRSVPTAEPLEDAEGEIARTFLIAEIPAMPVLALAAPELRADRHDPKEALAYLGDLGSVDRLLFSLETPARRAARLRRTARWKAGRALVAAALAVGMGGYAFALRAKAAKRPPRPASLSEMARTRRTKADAQARLDHADRANHVLDAAFRPAQTVTDVVQALADAATGDAWFTGLTVTRSSPIGLTGMALHGADVSKCLAAVASDPRFKGMRLVSTNKGLVGKTPVTQFALTGSALGTPPFDRPLKKEKKAPAKPGNKDR